MKKFQICGLFLLSICLLIATAACGGKQTTPTNAPQDTPLSEMTENGSAADGAESNPDETGKTDENHNDETEIGPEDKKENGKHQTKKPPKPRKMPAVEIPKRRLPIRPVPMPNPEPKPVL